MSKIIFDKSIGEVFDEILDWFFSLLEKRSNEGTSPTTPPKKNKTVEIKGFLQIKWVKEGDGDCHELTLHPMDITIARMWEETAEIGGKRGTIYSARIVNDYLKRGEYGTYESPKYDDIIQCKNWIIKTLASKGAIIINEEETTLTENQPESTP